jgi:hypothetical protein
MSTFTPRPAAAPGANDPMPVLGAMTTRPRAWPRFARMRMRAVTAKLRTGGR